MNRLLDELPRTAAVIVRGIERGWQRGVQLSVSHAGRVIDGALGESHDDVPLTGDTLLPWLSAGKPLTAVAILKMVEQGRFSLETPVAELLPEFAATSTAVTVHHLLTHTAGLAAVSSGWPQADWHDIVSSICQSGLRDDWVPGARAGYDPVRSWYLLGEIVRRLDGRPIEQHVREEILQPLGMHDSWMAMPEWMHREYGDRIGRTYQIIGGQAEATPGHTTAYCTTPSPGASCRGPVRELRLFYEMLLAGGVTSDGTRLLSAETVDLMTQRHRVGLYDETFRHTLDFGLGLILNSSAYGADTVPYGYGPAASVDTYGHGGARSCIAFADPQRQLVVCIAANGLPTEPVHHKRFRELLAALADDLGLRID